MLRATGFSNNCVIVELVLSCILRPLIANRKVEFFIMPFGNPSPMIPIMRTLEEL